MGGKVGGWCRWPLPFVLLPPFAKRIISDKVLDNHKTPHPRIQSEQSENGFRKNGGIAAFRMQIDYKKNIHRKTSKLHSY
jgi:hypothetical protein